jgi:drug/metabolite transporter (DMT)-like permease
MDAALKQLAGHYAPMQVSFLRGAASLPVLLAVVAWRGAWRELKPVRWGLHLVRGALAVLMLGAFIFSVSLLSLADSYAIFLCAPLLVTALSVPLLGEPVGWRRWLAIGAGMLGVVIILRPSGAAFATLGGLAALISAVCYALSAISIRILARSDTALSTVFWFMMLLTLFSGLLAVPGWQAVQAEHWGFIVWIGVTGAIAQALVTKAFRNAPSAVIAPFEYTALLWGIGLDFLFWSVLPDLGMLAGAAIVVSSGLYIIFRERRVAAPATAGQATPFSGVRDRRGSS